MRDAGFDVSTTLCDVTYPTGPAYYPPPQPPQPPRRRGMSTPMLILTIVGSVAAAMCLVGAAIAAFAPDPNSTASGAAATSVPTPYDLTTPAAAATSAAPASTKPPASPPPPAGPKTSFGDGTWEVGTDIAAGKYRATVPADSFACYWERLRGLSGQFDDIIANGTADPGTPVVVTVSGSDKGFTSRGCGTWAKA